MAAGVPPGDTDEQDARSSVARMVADTPRTAPFHTAATGGAILSLPVDLFLGDELLLLIGP